MKRSFVPFACLLLSLSPSFAFDRLTYQNPEITVDLGVGLWAWPMPMDWDNDGDLDLLISCPDVPFNGTYFFENPGNDPKQPIFRPPVRVGKGMHSIQASSVEGQPRILTAATEWTDFLGKGLDASHAIYPKTNPHTEGRKIRANQWRYVDYDGDDLIDLSVGIGDWEDYGWDDAFNEKGEWTRGPLRGHVYIIRNRGTNDTPDYEEPFQVMANDKAVDVFGMPSPNFADFDGDGDLDLVCGEFLDGFTYFQNVGTRENPRYAAGERLTHEGEPLRMDLQMITPTAIDWDKDGDIDLIVGDEDGRVALLEHTGEVIDHIPQFLPPIYFKQEPEFLKFGALATPVSFDWDADGDEDLLCGNSAGYIAFIENLDGGAPPKWAAPQLLEVDGTPIRLQAGSNGSIQGPAEAKWGYTTLTVADWDHDGSADLVVNSIWGKTEWFRNKGEPGKPDLEKARSVEVSWPDTAPKPEWNWWNPENNALVTQWRTTPYVIDLNHDGLNDLVMLDHEGYLSWFERIENDMGDLILLPGERIFTDAKGEALRLNDGWAGKSGRRKLCFADWDGDGRLDLLLNSTNADFYRNVSTEELPWAFENLGPVSEERLAGHTTSPTIVDWNRDSRPDLVIGGEDGHFYYLENSR